MMNKLKNFGLGLLVLAGTFGCGARDLNPIPFAAAYANCTTSNLGSFQVGLSASTTNPGTYQISVTTGIIPTAGQLVRIALVNNGGTPRDLTSGSGVSLTQNSTIFTGYLSSSDLSVYQAIAIVPPSGAPISFADENNPDTEFCNLPSVTTQSTVY